MTMDAGALLYFVLLMPLFGSGLCLLLPGMRSVLTTLVVGVLGTAGASALLGATVFAGGPVHAAGDWFFLDALSAYHLAVLQLVYLSSTVFAVRYFAHEAPLARGGARRFGALWFGSLGAMTLVLVSNHLGLMWVGIESTTLVTTFLISLHRSKSSLEATWKYLIICSVGIAIAFMGILLVGASATRAVPDPSELMLWTRLRESATLLDPALLKIAFLFLLVGYGTKVGLAPMHTWLPDAHSQAPAPVSAIFSGIMLNTALYCLMRYIPVIEAATGHQGFCLRLLSLFGLLSMLVAAAFILFQRDVKRLLAYHSVEHLGIITVALGLGGLGTVAAMFHTLNHSVCKSLGFYCAGRLGQMYGTHDMRSMPGTLRHSPLWGTGLLLSLLALIGVVPFAVFMSELQIVKAAADSHRIAVLALFLLAAGVVFIGAFGHATAIAWGKPPAGARPQPARLVDVLLVIAPLLLLLLLGLWMPPPLRDVFEQAARVIGPVR
jgi:hydrogenase-4 component F